VDDESRAIPGFLKPVLNEVPDMLSQFMTALSSPFRRFRFLLAIAVFPLLSTGELVAQSNYFGWHRDLSQAAKISKQTGKPIFLVFRCVR
jgi:hypothetical protein